MGDVAGRLLGDVGVCGGGGFIECMRGRYWAYLVYLRMGYGTVGFRIEAMCGWGWIPRFVLEDVAMVSVWPLYQGLTSFSSKVGCAGC